MACYYCTKCGELKDDDHDPGEEDIKDRGLICGGCYEEMEEPPSPRPVSVTPQMKRIYEDHLYESTVEGS